MYPVQPAFPSVAMWQRVLRIQACMYQDEQQTKTLEETHASPHELPRMDIHEQRASWKLWMERINNAQMLLLETNKQEHNPAEMIENFLETLIDSEEWENFDKFKDNDTVFRDIGRGR
jgi:hypothetical protein